MASVAGVSHPTPHSEKQGTFPSPLEYPAEHAVYLLALIKMEAITVGGIQELVCRLRLYVGHHLGYLTKDISVENLSSCTPGVCL